MEFGKAIGAACSSFAITNIDDMFVLVTFFAEVSISENLTPLKIILGQYIGFTVIVIISMIGFGAALALPSQPIGFLGLLPILVGVWKLFGLLFPTTVQSPESEARGVKSVLKVSLVTVMNGGDNISTYIPLFSQARKRDIAIYVLVYYILLGIWCLVAMLIMKQKHVLQVARKYARIFVPLLYIGLGIYIIVKSSSYTWAIQHINQAHHVKIGQLIMAVTTTCFLLICLGSMTWLKLRKKMLRPSPNLDSTNPEEPEGNKPDDPPAEDHAVGAPNGPETDSINLEAGPANQDDRISAERLTTATPNIASTDSRRAGMRGEG